MAVLGVAVTVVFHLQADGTDRYARRGDLDIAVSCRILLTAVIEVNKRLDVLVIKQKINGLCIVGGIQQHFIDKAQMETLLELHRAHH